MVFAVKFKVDPTHSGPLLPGVGADGIGYITTVVVAAGLVHPFTVTVTLYVPASDKLTFETEGFCNADVNPFGPVQEYVAPAIVFAVKFKVDPTHNGPLLPGVGADGIGYITTVVVAAGLVHPFTVTVALYVPAFAKVVFATDGFCSADVNPFGPVQL
jgi:hypothetical protein